MYSILDFGQPLRNGQSQGTATIYVIDVRASLSQHDLGQQAKVFVNDEDSVHLSPGSEGIKPPDT